MKKVFVHRYSGILSAYGLALAGKSQKADSVSPIILSNLFHTLTSNHCFLLDANHEEQEPTAEVLKPDSSLSSHGSVSLDGLQERATKALLDQGYNLQQITVERFLNLRYDGTDTSIMIMESPSATFQDAFEGVYQREFGFTLKGRSIRIDDYRVRASVPGPVLPQAKALFANEIRGKPPVEDTTRAYFEDGWHDDVPVYKIGSLEPGHIIEGPSIIVQPISTVVIELNCKALVNANGDLEISIGTETAKDEEGESIKEDPVQLSIFAHRFMGIAEQARRYVLVSLRPGDIL